MVAWLAAQHLPLIVVGDEPRAATWAPKPAGLVHHVGIAMVAPKPARNRQVPRKRRRLADQLIQQPALWRDGTEGERLEQLRRERGAAGVPWRGCRRNLVQQKLQ
eukprot:COSAG01_NODE_36351_length_519_cov_0.652381_1_plen_105_part_01